MKGLSAMIAAVSVTAFLAVPAYALEEPDAAAQMAKNQADAKTAQYGKMNLSDLKALSPLEFVYVPDGHKESIIRSRLRGHDWSLTSVPGRPAPLYCRGVFKTLLE